MMPQDVCDFLKIDYKTFEKTLSKVAPKCTFWQGGKVYTLEQMVNVAEIATRPQFINESIGELNKALDKSRYFYTDIKREGVMLYDNGQYKLARRRKLDFSEIGEMAKEYFEDKFPFANRFFENSKRDAEDGELRMSVFNLHQAAENYLRTIPMVFMLYGFKEHDLASLMNQCKKHTLEIYRPFPQDTDEERRLFKLLQDAYVQSRYNRNFMVTKEDINALIPK
ncbi:HEPN domain-containing protein, partial [Alistipes finegoldii]|uniref:HEPN domain-containing protein n=1 Tax=Alistipes finegoldii TaxID=214856 RepID=UPI0025AE0229